MATHEAHWELYPTEVDDALAWISYDHGASEHIASLPTTWVRVRVTLRHPDEGGLPTAQDFDTLPAVEDGVEAWLVARGAVPVGRVAYGGARYLSFYAAGDPAGLGAHLRSLGKRAGYTLESQVRLDPEHEAYFQELWPSDDDWVAVLDRQRLDVLLASGATLSEPHTLHRTVVFADPEAAEAFAGWAEQEGFTVAGRGARGDQVEVRFHHTMVPRLVDLAARSVAVRRKVEGLGGEDEGWEV